MRNRSANSDYVVLAEIDNVSDNKLGLRDDPEAVIRTQICTDEGRIASQDYRAVERKLLSVSLPVICICKGS